MKMIVATAALFALAGAAMAEPVTLGPTGAGRTIGTPDGLIVDQITGQVIGPGHVAQFFPDFGAYSTWSIDDFTTTVPYLIKELFALGTEAGGGAGMNLGIEAAIWAGTDTTLPPELYTTVGAQVGSDLFADFGGGLLAAGTHWIGYRVIRPFGGGGGQWFANSCTPVSGSEHWIHNPGGGFGFGAASIPAGGVFGSPSDLAFTLDGNLVPTPGTLALVGLGGLLAARRRR